MYLRVRSARHLVPGRAAAATTRASANSQNGCQRADAIHSLVYAGGILSSAGADASTSLCIMMSGSMGRRATSCRSAYRPTVHEFMGCFPISKHKRPCTAQLRSVSSMCCKHWQAAVSLSRKSASSKRGRELPGVLRRRTYRLASAKMCAGLLSSCNHIERMLE